MSISTELQGLIDARTSMKTSIANKGVTVPSDTKMEDIAGLIGQIEQSEPIYNGTKWTKSNVSASKVGNPVYGLGVWTAGNYYSLDGKSWISCTGSYPDSSSMTVLRRYDQNSTSGGFICYSGSTIYYSADGKVWSSVYSLSSGSIGKIVYNDKGYVGASTDGLYTFYSADGSSWSERDWSNYDSSGYGAFNASSLQCSNSRFGLVILNYGYANLFVSSNGTSWSSTSGGTILDSYYMSPNDYIYACYHHMNPSAVIGDNNENYAGIWINGSQVYTDPTDICYSIWDAFDNYVSIVGDYSGSVGAGIYKNGSQVSSWGLSSSESNIKSHMSSSHNDGDQTVIKSNYYSDKGAIYNASYFESEFGSVTADNSMWIDTEGHYSFNSSEWNTYTTDSGSSITFSHPVIYANGIWVGRKSSGGLYYSVAV